MIRTILSRRAALAGAAAVATLLLAGCGSNGDHGAMPGMNAASGSAQSGPAFNDADVTFAQLMIPHHQQAVQMAALADSRGSDAEVKHLAGQIKAAQDPEIATMTGWLKAWGKPTAAPSMGGMDHSAATSMPGMMADADMAKLTSATGIEFDKQFLTMMIAHHQGAIQMASDEVKNGSNSAGKELAQRIATSQQKEIDTMKKILARL